MYNYQKYTIKTVRGVKRAYFGENKLASKVTQQFIANIENAAEVEAPVEE